MATVIDALLVTLGLDPSAFKKGIEDSKKAIKPLTDEQKKQATEETRQFKVREEQARKTAQGIGKVRDGVIALTAAYIGGSAIKSFVERMTASGAKLGFVARNIDMNTKSLSAWQGVAEKNGGSAEAIVSDFKSISAALEQTKLTGAPLQSAPFFRAMHIDPVDLKTGKAKEQGELFIEVAKYLASLNNPVEAQRLGAGAGYSEETINVALKAGAALRKLHDEQEKRFAISPEDAKADQERLEAWLNLTYAFKKMGQTILTFLSPALKWMMQLITDHAPAVAILGASLLAISALRFVGVASSLAQLVLGLGAASTAATTLSAILRPILLLAAAGEAGYLLGNALGLGKDGEILGGWLYDKMHPGSAAAAGGKRAVASPAAAAGGAGSGPKAMFAGLEKQFGLPEGLLDSVWKQESNRGKNMRSPAGAMGHFQLMSATAKQYGVANPDDLAQSARGAAAMFADLLRQYGGNLPKALAAYNMGSGNLARRGMGNLTAETQKYIPQVMARMRGSQQNASTSTTDVKVGSITVNTQATDAKGIATDIGASMKQYAFATQANTGLN